MIFLRPIVVHDASVGGDYRGYREQLPTDTFLVDPQARRAAAGYAAGSQPAVSLLMDALKKAEETKRQAETGAFATAEGDSSAAAGRKATGANMAGQPPSLPALPSRLELLDDQFTAPRAAARQAGPDQAAAAAAQEKGRQAAAQVFAAKTSSSRQVLPSCTWPIHRGCRRGHRRLFLVATATSILLDRRHAR